MMRVIKLWLWVFCCTVLFLGVAMVSNASAFGIGVYGGGGNGSGEVEMDPDNGSKYKFDTDNKDVNVGLVLDSAVAKDKLFNYRLNLGYESYKSTDSSGHYCPVKIEPLVEVHPEQPAVVQVSV